MLSDMQANDVMGMIESFIEHADRGHENCILMLKHLYELHKLRDEEIYDYVYYKIIEPHAWFGQPPDPSIANLLAM